jgi:hypothetical protein
VDVRIKMPITVIQLNAGRSQVDKREKMLIE